MDEFESLIAFALGELDPARAEAMGARIANDQRLTRQLTSVRRFLAATSAEQEFEDAPPWLVARVKAALAGHRPPYTATQLSGLRRLVAEIVFDSRAQVAVAGYRGGIADFHLSLTSEVAEIDLQVSQAGGSGPAARWTLLGQVERASSERTTPPTPGAMILAHHADEAAEEVARATADEHGMFRMQLPPGLYDLSLRIDDFVVAVPALKIG